MRISVVLPAYNEEHSIKELIEEIYHVLGKGTEVIVVDDGSLDNTAKVSKECGAKVISNPYNMGNGASIKRGIREASSDVVVLMDADGQHSPQEIPKLIEAIDDYDMVIGQRKAADQFWWRKLANKTYNLLASYVSGVKIKDLTSGFRAIKREKAFNFLYLLPNKFSYPTTLTLSFIKSAYAVEFVPVNVLSRRKGKSKINLLIDGVRFLIIITKISVFFSPLKVFLPVSISFFSAGVFYYLYTFMNYHRFTNMSALLITASIIIFMLGLISEQIANLRLEKIDH
jgi:glycosyltransferase involved in cell wall biosynthesis